MRLKLKTGNSNWIKVGEKEEGEIEFLVDYPSRDQIHFLQTECKSDLEYMQYLLKFIIKDWRVKQKDGTILNYLLAEDGTQIKCELVKNELKGGFGTPEEEDIWWWLVNDRLFTAQIYVVCSKAIEFNEWDKKKLFTAVNFKNLELKNETIQ